MSRLREAKKKSPCSGERRGLLWFDRVGLVGSGCLGVDATRYRAGTHIRPCRSASIPKSSAYPDGLCC